MLAHMLKCCLFADCLQVENIALDFTLNDYGKPSCPNVGVSYFNIPRSSDYVALAIANVGEQN